MNICFFLHLCIMQTEFKLKPFNLILNLTMMPLFILFLLQVYPMYRDIGQPCSSAPTPGGPKRMDPVPPFRMDPESLDHQQVPVLSIDQIRALRANNDYVERPVALEPASQVAFYPHNERHPQMSRSQSQQQQHSHLAHLSRSSTVSSMSRGSAASDQRTSCRINTIPFWSSCGEVPAER